MNKTISILAILAILTTALLAGCVEMSAEQIVEKMQIKYESINDYKGTLVVSMSFDGESREMEADFMNRLQDNKFRQEIRKGEGAGNIMISNGTTMLLYNSTANEVTIMELPKTDNPTQADYGKLIKGMLEQNDVKLLGSEKIDGRDVFVLDVTPKNNSMEFPLRQKLWVDKETWMLLRIETCDKDGKHIMSMEYRNVEFNTDIPDNEFEFKIPQGARINTKEITLPKEITLDEARNAVNFTVAVPEYLPDGYLLDKVTVFKFYETQSLRISYKKGDEILSVHESSSNRFMSNENFETLKINGIEARYIETDFGKSISWAWNGTQITVSCTVSKENLIKVAESIK